MKKLIFGLIISLSLNVLFISQYRMYMFENGIAVENKAYINGMKSGLKNGAIEGYLHGYKNGVFDGENYEIPERWEIEEYLKDTGVIR